YAFASWLGVLWSLVAAGRLHAVRSLLERRFELGKQPRRSTVCFLALYWLSRVGEERSAQLLRAVDESIERGEVWESFLALSKLSDLHSGESSIAPELRLPAGTLSSLELRRRELGRTIASRVSDARRDRFLRFWSLESLALAADDSTVGDSISDAPSHGIDGLVKSWRSRHGLRALRVVLERSDGVLVYGGEADNSANAVTWLELAMSANDSIQRKGDLWITRLPGVAKGALVVEAHDVSPSLLRTLAESAAWRLEVDEARSALRATRSELASTRDELRTLASSDGDGKKQFDTEPIKRRSRSSFSLRDEEDAQVPTPVAVSPRMREILSQLPRIASNALPVVLVGESGVGKDLIARWIHHLSGRDAFLAELCSVPESLLESELFGVARGAYTDAVEDRAGLFERADGGTLYLDEIGELSGDVQARLVRVLETREVRRLGDDESRPVDFRLIASTKLSLDELRESSLRDDVFYRLSTQVVEIPPLRERPEDIAELVTRMAERRARARGEAAPLIPSETLARCRGHPWPGNVRELESRIERALVENPREIRAESLFAGETVELPDAQVPTRGLREDRDAFERQLVERALRAEDGNARRAAERLGITRRHLGKLFEKHGIQLAAFKKSP
ncbi:MAG: sigma 54-interacting transcriptional regulator, partial [Planctomycetota bacterium]